MKILIFSLSILLISLHSHAFVNQIYMPNGASSYTFCGVAFPVTATSLHNCGTNSVNALIGDISASYSSNAHTYNSSTGAYTPNLNGRFDPNFCDCMQGTVLAPNTTAAVACVEHPGGVNIKISGTCVQKPVAPSSGTGTSSCPVVRVSAIALLSTGFYADRLTVSAGSMPGVQQGSTNPLFTDCSGANTHFNNNATFYRNILTTNLPGLLQTHGFRCSNQVAVPPTSAIIATCAMNNMANSHVNASYFMDMQCCP